MKRIIRLTESDLTRIVKRVISEEDENNKCDEWIELNKLSEEKLHTMRLNIKEKMMKPEYKCEPNSPGWKARMEVIQKLNNY